MFIVALWGPYVVALQKRTHRVQGEVSRVWQRQVKIRAADMFLLRLRVCLRLTE